jgi:spectinomycin phosphotransferase
VNESPTALDTDELLTVVRRSWDPSVEALEHLAVGFGAHHWRARVDGEPRYFVTLDDLGERHTLQTLQAAYAGARREGWSW